MKKYRVKSDGRRGFLISTLRSLFLGGIVFASGLLGWREIRAAEDETLCVINVPCRNCSKRTDCTNPKTVE